MVRPNIITALRTITNDIGRIADGETDYCGSMAIIPPALIQTALGPSTRSASATSAPQDRSASEDVPNSDSALMAPLNETDETQERGPLWPKSVNESSERPKKAQRTNDKSHATDINQAKKGNGNAKLMKPSKQKNPKVKSDKSPNTASSSTPTSRSRSSITPNSTPQKSRDSTPRKRATPPARRMLARAAEVSRTSPLKKISRKATPRTDSHLVEASEDKVNCFCGAQDEADGSMQCDGCGNWVHCPCVGYDFLSFISGT